MKRLFPDLLRRSKLLPTIGALATVANIGLATPAHAEPTGDNQPAAPEEGRVQVPVNLEIDTGDLPPSIKAAVITFTAALAENLVSWANFRVQLPETDFGNGVRIIDTNDLYKAPKLAENYHLDDSGKIKDLSSADLESIAETALVIIPSKEYPGMNHVVRLSGWLQTGSKNIDVALKKDLASGLWNLKIAFPRTMFQGERLNPYQRMADDRGFLGRRLNSTAGWKNVLLGLRGVFGSLIGLVETEPRYTDAQIKQMIGDQKINQSYEYAFMNGGHRSGYLQVMNPAIHERVAPVLEQISSSVQQVSTQDMASLIQQYPSATNEELEIRLQAVKNERFVQGLMANRAQIESINGGLTQALIDHVKVLQITFNGEQEIQKRVEAERAAISAEIAKANPANALNTQWLDLKVEKQLKPRTEAFKSEGYAAIERELRAAGLGQAADVVKANQQFLVAEEKRLEAELKEQKIPSGQFDYQIKIWSPSNYIPAEAEITGLDGKTTKVKYKADFKTKTVKTNHWFWRWKDGYYRGRAVFKDWNHWLVVRNLIEGPYGYRSLFEKEPFIPRHQLVGLRGLTANVDSMERIETFRYRFKKVWAYVAESKRKFEERPDSDVLSKDRIRKIHYVWNTVIKGGGLTLLVATQPVAFLANAALTGAGVLSSVLWAPAYSLLVWGFNATIYDTRAPGHTKVSSRIVPPYHLARQIVFGGVVPGLEGLAGGAYYGLTGVTQLGAAHAIKAVHSTYDLAMREIFLRPHGRVPGEGSSLGRRIQGPGLSSDFFFQVEPEISVLTLKATLESLELEAYQKRTLAEINQPVEKYRSVMTVLLGAFISPESDYAKIERAKHPGLRAISERSTQLRDELEKAIRERVKLYGQLIDKKVDRSLVRQTKEDLEKTLRIGTALVQDFYENKILVGLSEHQIQEFWVAQRLPVGAWEQLTKKLLTQSFSNEFLTPLEDTDSRFRMIVESPGLRAILDLYDGEFRDRKTVVITPVPPTQTTLKREVSITAGSFVPQGHVRACEIIFR